MIGHQEYRVVIPTRISLSSAGPKDRETTPRFRWILCFALLALALGLLTSLRLGYGDGVTLSATSAQPSTSQELAEFTAPDFGPHLGSGDYALALVDTLRNELPFNQQRGKPDPGTLPPALLFIGLGLTTLRVSLANQCPEDDSPRVKLRVCRPRPPTFHS